ncbi:MAG: hypothetical protein AB8G15_17170 [Saprospiraceae bacterium]
MKNKTREYFESLLIKDDVEKVFGEMLDFSRSIQRDHVYNDLVILWARWNRIRKRRLSGILSFQQCSVEENRITNSIQNYIKKLFD